MFFFTASEAYRLIHNSADGLPGVDIDWLCGHVILTTHTSGADTLLEPLAAVLMETLKPQSVTVKNNTHGRSLRNLPLREATLAGITESRTYFIEAGVKYDCDFAASEKSFPLLRRPLRLWLSALTSAKQKILVVGLEPTGLLSRDTTNTLHTIGEVEYTLSDLTFALRKLPPHPTFAAAVVRIPMLNTTANRTAAHHLLHQICLRLQKDAALLIETRDLDATLIFLRRFSQKNGQRIMISDQRLAGPDFATDLRFSEREPKFLRLTVRAELS